MFKRLERYTKGTKIYTLAEDFGPIQTGVLGHPYQHAGGLFELTADGLLTQGVFLGRLLAEVLLLRRDSRYPGRMRAATRTGRNTARVEDVLRFAGPRRPVPNLR